MKKPIFLSVLIVIACDFNNPNNNSLLDLNQPIVLSEIASMNVSVVDSNFSLDTSVFPFEWIAQDVSNSSGWTRNRDQFQIQLKNRGMDPLARPQQFHLTFESRNFISLIGFDSIALNYNIDIYNLNDYYDDVIILRVGVQRIEFQLEGDGFYQPLQSVDQILDIDLPIKFRLYMILNSGIQGSARAPRPYNEATYTITYGIYGFYE